ncbi:MAG: sigma-70 family RNA polymerase sigma factor [Planctomycetes bacterium]|nr:sigma-70 family RNA polymerase sigma factor [Planctomycetota bacterium]
MERHLLWIREFVSARLGPKLRAKAETLDFVQDALLDFLRFVPRFKVAEEVHFRALMARIIDNTLRDGYDWFAARRRDMAREQPLPPDSVLDLDRGQVDGDTPSHLVAQSERQAWIRMGIELLSAADRQAIVLRDWDELSFPEIGKQVGITEEAARKRYLRAVRRLASAVESLRKGRMKELLQDGLDVGPV